MYDRCTLLFPSYIETFGLPLAEAAQSGNPILAADTPFAHEILAEYGNAYFFQPSDCGRLAELMQDVLDGRIVKRAPAVKKETSNSYREIINIITDGK